MMLVVELSKPVANIICARYASPWLMLARLIVGSFLSGNSSLFKLTLTVNSKNERTYADGK
jgi:hypothetical protein